MIRGSLSSALSRQKAAPHSGWERDLLRYPNIPSYLFIIHYTSRGFSAVINQGMRLLEHAGQIPKKPDERRLYTCEAATHAFWPKTGHLSKRQACRETPAHLQDMHTSPQLPVLEYIPAIHQATESPEALPPRGNTDKRWRGTSLITSTGFSNPAASQTEPGGVEYHAVITPLKRITVTSFPKSTRFLVEKVRLRGQVVPPISASSLCVRFSSDTATHRPPSPFLHPGVRTTSIHSRRCLAASKQYQSISKRQPTTHIMSIIDAIAKTIHWLRRSLILTTKPSNWCVDRV
ncbi:hypothetical protein N431DRAFT_68297 [Stipitochalara longipes BDJ]|nr:hypothetical protein N431DRAFT_68297 [Stipitochalara longipes BDJ]